MLYFPFDSAVAAPFTEPTNEGIGNLARQCLPRLVILVGKDLLKLRDGEMSQIDQAGRVVDDQAYGVRDARVDHRDSIGRQGRRCAAFLGEGLTVRKGPACRHCKPNLDAEASAPPSRKNWRRLGGDHFRRLPRARRQIEPLHTEVFNTMHFTAQ